MQQTKSKKFNALRKIINNLQLQPNRREFIPIEGRMDRAFALEMKTQIPLIGQVKPNTIKIGIYSFPV